MKKRLTFITLLVLFCSTVFSQSYYWEPVVPNVNTTMTITASVQFDGIDQYDSKLELGVFCGDQCRATAFLEDMFDGEFPNIAMLSVKGSSGENFKLKVYNHTTGEIKSNYVLVDNGNELSQTSLPFITNIQYGTIDYPLVVNFKEPDYFIPETTGDDGTTTLRAVVQINGVEQYNSKLEVGAFINGIVKGSAKTEFIYNERNFVRMNIGGNDQLLGQTVTFKLYDHALGEELAFAKVNSVEYTGDKIGSMLEPFVINFITTPFVINDQPYNTLAAAVEAATEDNNVITLLKDVEGLGVEINKEVTIDFAGFAYTLNEGEVINIKEGGVVTFLNDTKIENGVELNGGQLFTKNTNLTIKAVKHFAKVEANTTAWGTISTPIAGAKVPTITGLHDLYTYNEESMTWVYGGSLKTFELGQGYLYANTHENNGDDIAIELQGVLNTKDAEVKLSYNEGSLAGFNMIGNPFSFNISEANFTTTDGAQLANGFYVISDQGAIVARPDNAVIAPMESVMVQTSAKTTLTISKLAQSKRNAADNGMIAINVANDNYSDVAYVSFNEGIGLNKINHHNADVPMVYVPVEGENFAVAMMNQDVTEIPVSFRAATMGEYTISVEAQGCEYGKMILKDRLTGNVTNLLIEDYTFVATSNDNADRFVIELSNSQQSSDNSNFAYINNGMINIDNVEGQAVVRIYDVTGRSVAEYNAFETASISTSSLSNGIYIIKMTDNNGVKVQKILID
ncbi:MAG: T9SS type A sorting domain-containing protein [Bacteroidales bacterium]|nr:T9SS type A sorting domain-containing protein [Bacteroidales bacterium]